MQPVSSRKHTKRYTPLFLSFLAFAGIAACSRAGLLAFQEDKTPTSQTRDASPDSTDATPPLICIPGTFPFTQATTKVMFVIDRSGSMADALDDQEINPPRERSKWGILEASLTPALSQLETTIDLGAKFFPEQPALPIPPNQANPVACSGNTPPEVSPSLNSARRILDVFKTTEPIGGTPTQFALEAALSYLKQDAGLFSAKFLVLATDGAPNCSNDERITFDNCVCTNPDSDTCLNPFTFDPEFCLDQLGTVSTIQNTFIQEKIPTYVLGIGSPSNSIFKETLNLMAKAGGRAQLGQTAYFEASTTSQMNAAVSQIQKEVSQCVYVTTSRPDDPDAMVIEVDGKTIPRDTTRQNGWDWIDQSQAAVSLFGDSCSLVQAAGKNFTANVKCKE